MEGNAAPTSSESMVRSVKPERLRSPPRSCGNGKVRMSNYGTESKPRTMSRLQSHFTCGETKGEMCELIPP